MGALYEDVERFFGDIFAAYGRVLAKWPFCFIIASAVLSGLLGFGLFKIRMVTDVELLYTPIGSDAQKHRDYLSRLFESNSTRFYSHQQFYVGPHADLIFTRPFVKSNNILVEDSLSEIDYVIEEVMNITDYERVCARNGGQCAIDGIDVMRKWSTEKSRLCGLSGANDDVDDFLAVTHKLGDCVDLAKALKIRFYLRRDDEQILKDSKEWQKRFISLLNKLKSELNYTVVNYAATESLSIELNARVRVDLKKFAFTVLIMIIYTTMVSCGGNWVTSRIKMSQAGIIAALLAILGSCGLLSVLEIPFADSCGVMPFLVLGVGVDDMFILMSGWRQTEITSSVDERIAQTLRSSAISVTITSLTDLLAFCIGATTPFYSVRCFCVYAGVAIFLCYFNQLTFFAGCLVLHARRVHESRHCVTCVKTSSRVDLRRKGMNEAYVLLCSGHPSSAKHGEAETFCQKVPGASSIPKLLLTRPVKIVVCIAFIVYLIISAFAASKTKHGLKLEKVVSESSYFTSYLEVDRQYFAQSGPVIMLVVDGIYDYRKDTNRQLLIKIMDKAKSYGNMDKSYQISWIRNCTNFENISEFIEKNPSFEQDIAWKDGRIIASRFYVRSRWVSTADEEGDLMKFMRDTVINDTNGSKLIAFSPQFVYFEHYVSIVKNTLLSVTVCIIGMLFVAIMFIPHPISITCVALSMLSIVIGMFGLMHLWNVALSSITTVQIILSVGLCVDFTVHISHAFMAATGKNRNERVSTALNKVGVPILNGALSSILGIIMLASAHSYIFVSFFKTMLLVIILGVFHSLLVLPVLLSFIGPRRTSKPRVYIPISPSSRSIQPMEAIRRPSSLRGSNNQRLYKQDSKEDQESYTTPRESPRRQSIPLVRFDVRPRITRQDAMEESSIIIHHAPTFPQFNATTQTETPSGLAVGGVPRSISADGRTISQDSRSDGFYSATEELNDNDSFISAFGFFT